MKKIEAEQQEIQETEIVEVRKIHHHDLENGNLIPMDAFSSPTDSNILHHLTKIEKKLDELSGEVQSIKGTVGQLDVDLKGNNWAVRDLRRVANEIKNDLTLVSGRADGNRTHLDNIQTEMKEMKESVKKILELLKSR